MSATDKACVSIEVAVTPAVAFRVFTEQVDSWWKRGPQYRSKPQTSTMRFDPGKGGRLVESYGDGDEHEFGRILHWDDGRRLVFEWRGINFQRDQMTEVEVRFEATDTGTRVVIEHRGWDRLPLDHPARHKLPAARFVQMLSSMWADQLVAAKHHVERVS